jgi:hypothetical protein
MNAQILSSFPKENVLIYVCLCNIKKYCLCCIDGWVSSIIVSSSKCILWRCNSKLCWFLSKTIFVSIIAKYDHGLWMVLLKKWIWKSEMKWGWKDIFALHLKSAPNHINIMHHHQKNLTFCSTSVMFHYSPRWSYKTVGLGCTTIFELNNV